MQHKITSYYDKLALEYDQDRFGNSYGQYIDAQEQKIVAQYLKNTDTSKNLDVACGTGRFLRYAHYGIDASQNMIAVSQEKYPEKALSVQDATNTNFSDNQFERITCFHLLMHLDKTTVINIFDEWHRILSKDGILIVDVPVKARRNLLKYKANEWHGANAYDKKDMQHLINDKWEIKRYIGIAFFPIHRIPKRWRRFWLNFDNFICRTWLKNYASYMIYILKKR